MIIDALIAIVVVFSMVFGFRAGFVRSFLHAAGWLLSIALAFTFAPKLSGFLAENTGLYDALRENLSSHFADTVNITRISQSLPSVLKDLIESLTKQAADTASVSVANLFFTIVTFLIVIITVKFVFFLLILLLSKQGKGGAGGMIDGALGLFMGFIKGIFITFSLLAVLIPLIGLVDANLSCEISGMLDSSYFSGTLYDNNILVLIVRDFLL